MCESVQENNQPDLSYCEVQDNSTFLFLRNKIMQYG